MQEQSDIQKVQPELDQAGGRGCTRMFIMIQNLSRMSVLHKIRRVCLRMCVFQVILCRHSTDKTTIHFSLNQRTTGIKNKTQNNFNILVTLWSFSCSSKDPIVCKVHLWFPPAVLTPAGCINDTNVLLWSAFLCTPAMSFLIVCAFFWCSKRSDGAVCRITWLFLWFLMQVYSNSFERHPFVKAVCALFSLSCWGTISQDLKGLWKQTFGSM